MSPIGDGNAGDRPGLGRMSSVQDIIRSLETVQSKINQMDSESAAYSDDFESETAYEVVSSSVPDSDSEGTAGYTDDDDFESETTAGLWEYSDDFDAYSSSDGSIEMVLLFPIPA